jgi:hypothetical protein
MYKIVLFSLIALLFFGCEKTQKELADFKAETIGTDRKIKFIVFQEKN